MANVVTCTICCASWPCTTMAIRWVQACEPDVVMISLTVFQFDCYAGFWKNNQGFKLLQTDGGLIYKSHHSLLTLFYFCKMQTHHLLFQMRQNISYQPVLRIESECVVVTSMVVRIILALKQTGISSSQLLKNVRMSGIL